MEEKTPLSHEVVCFQMLDFGTSKPTSEVSKSNSLKITSFVENYVTSEEAMFYTINSPLPPFTRYQVSFYA